MAEGGTCPQVFVVDSQVSHITVPGGRKPRWAREGWKILLLLVGLSMLGMVIEGCLIYNLYQKTETFKLCGSHPLCHNFSHASPFGENTDGTLSRQVGSTEYTGTPFMRTQTQRRPFAHLLGSSHGMANNVVLWEKAGESVIQNMTYDKGLLIVQQAGYYYLYSKLQLNSFGECTLIQHKVMRNTSAYGEPMELMKSKNYRCRRKEDSGGHTLKYDLWSSFLGGIFELQQGDRIFVTLDKEKAMQTHTENFMGAFMIYP